MRSVSFNLFILCLISFGICSCNPSVSSNGRELALFALAYSIEQGVQDLNATGSAEAATAFQWAQENLKEFELLLEDKRMEITREDGNIISEVSRARRLLKDQSKRRESIANSTTRTLLQLRALGEAISAQATHDSQGTLMDSAYLSENIAREIQMGQSLKKSIDETATYAAQGMAKVREIKPQSDSLQTALRGQLAKLILESTPDE